MYIIWILFILLFPKSVVSLCQFKVAGKELKISDAWEWKTYGNNKDIYIMSLCTSPKLCKNNANVCKQDGEKLLSYGTIKAQTYTSSLSGNDFEIFLKGGDECPSNSSKKLSAKIIVSCGRTLGQLEFIEEVDCISYFEFSTNEICNDGIKHDKQVPCYIFNNDNQKIDLTALQKVKGSQKATSFQENMDFQFNLCTDIVGNKNCADSASCMKKDNQWYNIGQINNDSKLQMENNQVVLKYVETKSNYLTVIRLHCPSRNTLASVPVLLHQSNDNHNFEIFWSTEHACPIKEQIVRNSCSITTSDGYKFDLSVMKQENKAIKFTYTDKSDTYDILMNVCGALPTTTICNKDSKASICQTKQGSSQSKVLGSFMKSTLRYTDRKLIYTLKNGQLCSSQINRTTVITFHCDINALNSQPVFDYEDACTYFFNWRTNHACPYNRPMGSECRVVSENNVVYDLTPLSKQSWQVDNNLNSNGGVSLSVCGLISDKTCGDSSLCVKNNKQSLGKYKSPIQLLSNNELLLSYVEGYTCDKKPVQTNITFHCSPGQTTSLPVLVKAGCDYQLTWNTAYACPLVEKIGHRCYILNDRLQLHIDLSFLKPPNGKWFNVPAVDGNEYQINICEGSKQTACNTGVNINQSVSVCQHPKTGTDNRIAGLSLSNEKVEYYGGVLKLLLTDGEKCHQNHKNRSSEIIFVCNYTAGIGNPIFEKEKTHCFYRFIWETKYACLPKPGICSIERNNKLYDLSALTRSANQESWKYKSSDGTYYINVCKPQTFLGNFKCSPFSGICFVLKDTAKQIDYGSVAHDVPLEINKNNELVMKYRLDDGTCSVEITFVCGKDGLGAPLHSSKTGTECKKYLIWHTSAACTQEDEISSKDNCQITDNKNNVFDLNVLTHPYEYNITATDGKLFHINVCKQSTSCKGGDFAACFSNPPDHNKNTVIGKITKKLKIVNERVMLEYRYGSPTVTRTVIKFYCNHAQVEKKIQYERFDTLTNTYYFTMDSSKVCKASELQCAISNEKGENYNMEPLRKLNGYWSALSRSMYVHWFYVNLCTPMRNLHNQKCRDTDRGCVELIGGVVVGFDNRQMHLYDKTVVYHYESTQSNSYHATVYFHCSTNQGSLYFQMNEGKSMIFNWLTPAACPIRKQTGSMCKVTDNRNEHIYDLSSLDEFEMVVKDSSGVEKKLHINVCEKSKHCTDKSGACLTGGKTNINYGDFNQDLQFEVDGKLSLKYTAAGRSVTINFVCNVDTTPKVVTPTANGYVVEWPTKLACKQKDIECSATDSQGNIFDFSPLSKREYNWQASVNGLPLYKTAKIFINVCRPLVKKNIVDKCSHSAGICIVDNDGKSINVGQMENSPVITEKGDIILEYKNGDICQGTTRYSAKIEIFPANANIFRMPILDRVDGCVYHFDWSTSVGWHILHKERASNVTDDCKVENKLSGYTYDFNPLGKTNVVVADKSSDEKFQINICNMKEGKPYSSICKLDESGTLKDCIVNKNQVDSNSILYMNFNSNSKAVINFICDADANPGKPVLMSNPKIDEIKVFVWRTAYACEHVVQCDAFDNKGNMVSLDQLKFPGYYEVNITSAPSSTLTADDKLRINVCQNIVSTDCPHQAAVCNVNKKKNLGRVVSSPVLKANGDVEIVYSNGDTCDVDRTKKFQSTVVFTCDENIKAPAVWLKSVVGCTYNFVMKTPLLCKHETVTTVDCVHKHGAESFDLNVLKKKESERKYEVKSSKTPSNYYEVNICATTSISDATCKGAAVCLAMSGATSYKNFGMVKGSTWKDEYSSGILNLNYKSEGASTTIKFVCDPMKALGSPILIDESATTLNLEWKTSLLCPAITLSESYKQVSLFFPVETSAPMKNLGIAHMSIAGYRSKPNKPKGCPRTAAVCYQNGDQMFVLGLLQHSTLAVDDSDGGVTIHYSESNYKCDSLEASVSLKVSCSTKKEEISFDRLDKNACVFHFIAAAPVSACKNAGKKPKPTKAVTDSHKSSAKGENQSKAKRNGTAIAVLAVSIVAAIFLICCGVLLSSSDRRSTCMATVRSLVCFRKKDVPSYKYHKLNPGDSDEELETLVEASEADESNGRAGYHDDRSADYNDDDSSDEELLRL